MASAAAWARAGRAVVHLALLLGAVRVLAPPPNVSDPPDMHAFYHTWMQPSWWLIAALLVLGLQLPWLPEYYHWVLDELEKRRP